MQLACTSLWAGDCDTAVAGGLNVMTNSDIFAGLSRGQFLSKTGNCQTFDNDADGCEYTLGPLRPNTNLTCRYRLPR